MSVFPIAPIAAIPQVQVPAVPAAAHNSFENLISQGIDSVNGKVANADALVQQFVLDDSVPVHQVTYALEQAHLSLELMLQVRSRLIEGYQQLMNMQL